MNRKSKLLIGVTIILGLAFVLLMTKLKQPPEQAGHQHIATPVKTLIIAPQTLRVETLGFGQVTPVRSWQAIANVGGRVVWKNNALKSGNIIGKGTSLVQIDTTRYELAEAAAQADLLTIQAEMQQIKQEELNTRELLELENQRLELAEKELARSQSLVEKGALSQARLDEQQRVTLQQQQAVQTLKNQLRLMPVRLDALSAGRARIETTLKRAQEDLKDTQFVAPYDLRVHQADVEVDQFMSPGQVLFIGDDITAAEVTVQLKVTELRRVLAQSVALPGSAASDAKAADISQLQNGLGLADLEVWVYPTSMSDVRWRGRLSRIASSIDLETRTVQAIVTVSEPYTDAAPPMRPPLVRGLFTRVSIAANTRDRVVVIPSEALHGDTVYLVSENDELERRQVALGWQQGELAIIAAGLEVGERVILDDLVPAIEGMPLVVTETIEGIDP